MQFLSAEWFELRAARLAGFTLAEQLDLRVQHVVSDCPGGTVIRYYDEVCDGRLRRCGLGDIDDPQFTLFSTCQDELDLLRGRLDPYVAVVEGVVRIEGPLDQLLSFLPLLSRHQRELDLIAADLAGAVHPAG